ncbi:MAG: iron-sulfur cluster assembly scaffold protein [Pseudomonadota bacterium]
MSESLYQDAIMAAADAKIGHGRLSAPNVTATVDNPLCGDRITMDVDLDGETIVEVGHLVRGCLLCEATASLIAQHAPGIGAEELLRVAEAVHAMLKDARSLEQANELIRAFTIFEPVIPHKSRHECVMLSFDAINTALAERA